MSDIKITNTPPMTGSTKSTQADTKVNRAAAQQVASVEVSNKVLELKTRIENGTYKVDANKLADKILNIISS
jgi:anti-sigma28 factor (negative regulator of flagellin synthesis)